MTEPAVTAPIFHCGQVQCRPPKPGGEAWLDASRTTAILPQCVNRLWGYLMGVGLIEPLDDIRANPRATDSWVSHREFVHSGQHRHILRLVCQSAPISFL